MNFVLQRFSDNKDSTLGLLFEQKDGKLEFHNYTLEDEYREQKVSAETRVPAGFYELKIQTLDTDLTKKYRERYPWFKNHIEVTGIANFKGVYCHIGNKDEDTAGCLLFGDTADNNKIANGFIGNSTTAFKRWYERVFPHLEAGKKAFITIRDEKELWK
jgi:hypothetical protein